MRIQLVATIIYKQAKPENIETKILIKFSQCEYKRNYMHICVYNCVTYLKYDQYIVQMFLILIEIHLC